MTNSDNGNRPRTAAHHPGDRVRVKHNLRHDHHSYSVEQNRARQALAGQIGSIRERAPSGAYRVAPPGSTERGAWFEADELEPVASHAVGDRVKVAHRPELDRQFSTPSGAFARRRNDGYKGKITAESCGLFEVDTSGPERAWFDPSELEPVAEPVAVAPDPLALASRQAEEALQAADRWRAEYQTAKDELGAVQLALGETQREAKDARQEAREAKDALRAAEAERDALRASLVATERALSDTAVRRESEAQDAARQVRTLKVHLAAREDALADERGKLAAVAQAWGRCRTWWSPASKDERAALEAVDKALGGAAAKPERERWEQTVEARLGRLQYQTRDTPSDGYSVTRLAPAESIEIRSPPSTVARMNPSAWCRFL
jgi:hypothetical protein